MRSLLIAFLLISTAHAGEISGRVYLEKTNQNLNKIPMRLHIYKDDYELSGIETLTDSSGRYRFPHLNTNERYSYILYPIYEGINYPYQEVFFEKNKPTLKQDFPIEESTGSVANLSASEVILFEFGKRDIWKITHEIVVTNQGDLLYHSGRPDAEPILFSLFEGGFDLSYLEGVSRNNSTIDDQKDNLQVSLTLPAHQTYKIRFSYYYLPSSRSISFDRTSYIPRSNITLLFNRRIKLHSTQFQTDPMLLKEHPEALRAYTSGPIEMDTKITFEIKGFLLKQDFLHIFFAIACLLMLILMIYASLRYNQISKNQDKELTDKMHRYLIDLKKQYQDEKIDKTHLKKEEHRVRNFLFQLFKKHDQT